VAVARDITERKRAEAVLLENSRMLREMELARQIQLSLLPTGPPLLPGVRLAGCCVPAAHVGGDYYDYFRRENGMVDMVVADVSGHSIGAALMTSEVRSVLRANVHLFDSSGAILAALNDILYEDLNRAGLLITSFYLKYDVATRTLTYSNAGHVPPLLLSGSRGECLDLDAEGLILGIRKGVAFEEKRLVLEAGDLLLLYTDGISEAQDASGEMFGRDRLSGILKARREEEPDEIIDAVLREVTAFAGGQNLEDDVTMIVMKVA
jgi:phosphoserine phosphatase RsbU/P